MRGHYRALDRHLNCPRKLRLAFHRETRRMADELAGNYPGAAIFSSSSVFKQLPLSLSCTPDGELY